MQCVIKQFLWSQTKDVCYCFDLLHPCVSSKPGQSCPKAELTQTTPYYPQLTFLVQSQELGCSPPPNHEIPDPAPAFLVALQGMPGLRSMRRADVDAVKDAGRIVRSLDWKVRGEFSRSATLYIAFEPWQAELSETLGESAQVLRTLLMSPCVGRGSG